MLNARRRGDSDDEGAAPPVNHRYPSAGTPAAVPMTPPDISLISRQESAPVLQSQYLPSHWVLDPTERGKMPVTEGQMNDHDNNLQLTHGPSRDPASVTVLLKSPAPSSLSHKKAHHGCLIVANHSIPVEYLKEVALKKGDQPNGGTFGSSDDSSGGTIDQILSNLRSRPFSTAVSSSGSGSGSGPRASITSSLYPTLPRGERSGRDSYRMSLTGGSGHNQSDSPSSSNRKSISSPLYYFEITVKSLPEVSFVSIGLVVSDAKPSAVSEENDTSSLILPGQIKDSIGLSSKGELKVSGRTIEEKRFALEGFQAGDVVGCGLEVLGTRRVLFTKNGRTIVPPTRFPDIEPKINSYSPCLGIMLSSSSSSSSNNAVTIYGNFGSQSTLAFRWEDSEVANIVNSDMNQLDRKRAPNVMSSKPKGRPTIASAPTFPQTVEQKPASTSRNNPSPMTAEGTTGSANAAVAVAASGGRDTSARSDNTATSTVKNHSQVATVASSVPPSIFGSRPKPGDKSMLDDDSDYDHNNVNYRNNSDEHQGPQQTRRIGGWAEPSAEMSQLSAEVGALQSDQELPARGRKTDSSSSFSSKRKTLTSTNSGDKSGSKSPSRKLFGFGKGRKSSHQDDRNAELDSGGPNPQPKDATTSQQSQASHFFGTRNKKKSLDEDGDNDNDEQDNQQSPVAPQHLSSIGVNSSSASPAVPILYGTKTKKSNLDDDISMNTEIKNHMSPANTQVEPLPTGVSSSAPVGLTQYTVATGSAKNMLFFGKKSKRSSLDDDNPEDVHLQSALTSTISSSKTSQPPSQSPAPTYAIPEMASINATAQAPQSSTNLRATDIFGKETGRNSLNDDNEDDVRLQSTVSKTIPEPTNSPSNDAQGTQSVAATMPTNKTPSFYGTKSKKGSLEDDDPDDIQLQNSLSNVGGSAHNAVYGTRSKKSSLEDDNLDDIQLQRNLASTSNRPDNLMVFGTKSSKTSLEDDDTDDDQIQQPLEVTPSSNDMLNGKVSGAAVNAHSSEVNNAQLPGERPFPSSGQAGSILPASSSSEQPTPMVDQASAPARTPATPSHWDHPISAPIACMNTTERQGPSEEELLNAAIEASKRDQQQNRLKDQIAQSGALKDPEELESVRENARTLRSLCFEEHVESSILESLLGSCRNDQNEIQACLESDDPQVDLMELLTLNEVVLDAIKMGEKIVEGSKKRASNASRRSSKSNLNLDICALVEKQDVFSLICILRAQSDQRLDAALALMDFAKEADNLAEAGTRSLRDEIRSSGGMHSLITVYRSKGASYELRVVSALAVAYVLPSFVESSSVHPSVGLKIMECLRFLSTSRSVSPNGRRISREEMYKAAAMGVTTFWINELTPMLTPGSSKSENGERSELFSKNSKKGRRKGRTGGQRHQTLELQELLEMTVSLIVQIERLGESEELRNHAPSDSLFLWRYTNVEQVCAVDVARPIAVREGLLPILIGWIRSKDREKVRPAVSALRYLTSIQDKYMAGWIHSQMVNEGALAEVVKLADDYYVGQDVRLAVAQILASLCVAPHTRAAVVEAKCINYLIGFLYDHSDKASQDVALFAGSAIMQLAEGAITRASVLGGEEVQNGTTPDKSDTLVDDIVNSGAIGSFIAIAQEHKGNLRSMAIEAIRVLSEDTSPNRRTRSQLCEEGAAKALGRALRDDVKALYGAIKPVAATTNMGHSFDEPHDALCALANILEPIQRTKSTTTKLFGPSNADPAQNLIKGCIQTAESGGLDSLLWISRVPLTATSVSSSADSSIQCIDLLEEACRSLASLSPLLLSSEPASQGYASCASSVFDAFDRLLKASLIDTDNDDYEILLDLNISALRGLGALAAAEPLKIKIVDKTLPSLLQMRNSQSGGNDVSNVIDQVFLSLGFEEDEIAVHVAGSNPSLLADWFCLQRSLVIQAMARSELRKMLLHIWSNPFAEIEKGDVTRLIREANAKNISEQKFGESFASNFGEVDLFDNFADDDNTEYHRKTIERQYHDFYNRGAPSTPCLECNTLDSRPNDTSLLARHVYPLDETQTEVDWILGHLQSVYSKGAPLSTFCGISPPEHVEALLDSCFPSKLLRDHVAPVSNLRPDSSFNFRALTMPQRRYFSFRREGQLISRLCDKQAEGLDFDDIHWTLGFMNSTFAAEFSETLVQALYLCPTIRGLTFGKNDDFSRFCDLGREDMEDDGSGFIANLVGSLPPWIHSLTFSNIFNDRDVRTLVAIIETMGKLSSDQAIKAAAMGGYSPRGKGASSSAQAQGKFWSFAICSSPQVSQEAWHSFFCLLGRASSIVDKPGGSPLSSLKLLDVSFNNLGDETCALLLDLVHDPTSGCALEHLDLSGNRIAQGTKMIDVLHYYVEHHRYKSDPQAWKCSLKTLILASNDLGIGQAAPQLISLLRHNRLGLKTLDLSKNGFSPQNVDCEICQALISVLPHNTLLFHLNLSCNYFSSGTLGEFLEQLALLNSGSNLAFLGLENNGPPLTESQERNLGIFLEKSRRRALERHLEERDSVGHGMLEESANLADFQTQNLYKHTSSGVSAFVSKAGSDFSSRMTLDDSEREQGDNMITVLFSAPLVFTNERRQLKPFAKLDFDMERELMWQCMKEASRDIELSFDNATHDRLLAAITKRCSCLHYSGHGHPSYLPFEDGGGGPNWFKVEDIQRLIAREGAAPFKFVFVSACHSGLAGETFASAGVPHVVCCQQEFELKDTAALAFTRQFYLSLVIGHTVKESFEQGCKAVRATPNLREPEKEMKKFLLLPKGGKHDVPIFDAKAVPEWPKVNQRSRLSRKGKSFTRQIRNLHAGGARSSELGVRNMMQEDPSPTPPQFFLGREVEMYYVLKAILCKRLVSVVAEPGLGRSSLVCALCHYINERASTILAIERIYFVKAKRSRRVDGCRVLMEQLLRKLVESGKEDPPDSSIDMEDLVDFICKALKNEKALVVFDRMEYLENSDDAEEFPMLLSTLFRGTKHVKVLVTGRHPLGIPSLGGQVEYPFPLGPLTFENTLRLFANLCPHLHTAGERHKFFDQLVTDGEQSELRPSDAGINDRTKAVFKSVGDGIPSKIEQTAYDISYESLRELLEHYGENK